MNDNMIPPDDLVHAVDLGGGLILANFRHYFLRNPPAVRDLLPDDSRFWTDPVYLVYSPSLPTTIIASTEEQAQELEAINAALEGIGCPRIAVWSPSTAVEYVGDLQLTPGQTAYLISKVNLLATAARELGRQDVTARQEHLETLYGTMTAALLNLMLAYAVAGKSLLLCNQIELERIHQAAGQMLRATMVAAGSPIAQANLPTLPPASPAQGSEKAATEPDQGGTP